MTTLPELTEIDVQQWVGSTSFSRGRSYYRQGVIIGPRRQENLLKAQCQGSMPEPYYVQVTLGDEGISGGDCSCPVGAGGQCKHAAALLLTWIHDPQRFLEVEPLDKVLASRSQDELIGLIRQMVARYPDLEELAAMPMPTKGTGTSSAINPDIIRRQVQQALARGDYEYDYDSAATIGRELRAIMRQGDSYRQQGDWHSAALLYQVVVDELLERFEHLFDEEGHLGSVLYDGCEELATCLEAMHEAETRQEILQTLTNVTTKDTNMGGYGFGDAAYDAILRLAKASEKEQVAVWVEAEVAKLEGRSDFSSHYHRQAHGRFLLALLKDTLSDEAYLEICRRTDNLKQLVDRLLSLRRLNEAITAAQTAGDYELLALADVFVAHGHGATAEEVVWERMGTSKDTRLPEWLKQYAAAQGNWTTALKYALDQFWQRPLLEGYQELRELATNVGEWQQRRPEILARLAAEKHFDLLTRIHLLEEDVGAALATLAQATDRSYRLPGSYESPSLSIEVARAAEKAQPREAIRLYQQAAERLIEARGRDNYATAATYLQRVKVLYERLGEAEVWRGLIAAVREQNPRLRALMEELKRAGL